MSSHQNAIGNVGHHLGKLKIGLFVYWSLTRQGERNKALAVSDGIEDLIDAALDAGYREPQNVARSDRLPIVEGQILIDSVTYGK
jgi:hypothetical protein